VTGKDKIYLAGAAALAVIAWFYWKRTAPRPASALVNLGGGFEPWSPANAAANAARGMIG
jgi:hypothetical protein